MNTPLTPWVNLTLHQAQRCHHLAWFLYGWLEREQVLNQEAFLAWWIPGAASAARRSRPCRCDGHGPRPCGEPDQGPSQLHQADTGPALIDQASYLNDSETRAR
jgi:hypothetical protein